MQRGWSIGTLASSLLLAVHVSWTTHDLRTHSKQRAEIERPVKTAEPRDPENPSETRVIGNETIGQRSYDFAAIVVASVIRGLGIVAWGKVLHLLTWLTRSTDMK